MEMKQPNQAFAKRFISYTLYSNNIGYGKMYRLLCWFVKINHMYFSNEEIVCRPAVSSNRFVTTVKPRKYVHFVIFRLKLQATQDRFMHVKQHGYIDFQPLALEYMNKQTSTHSESDTLSYIMKCMYI